MRHSILLFAFSLSLLSCAQNEKEHKEQEATEKQEEVDRSAETVMPPDTSTGKNIPDIRSEYSRINSLALSAKKYEFVCDTDGTIAYFTDNGKVVKIAIDWGFIGDGSSTSEYYFKNDKLIFIYETTTGGPANGPATKTTYRNYVNDDHSIRYLVDQKPGACKTCHFDDSSREYKAFKAYETKDFKAALCN